MTFEDAKQKFNETHPELENVPAKEYALKLMEFYNRECCNGNCTPAEVTLMAALYVHGDDFWNDSEDYTDPNFVLLGDVFSAAKKMGYTIEVKKL